MFNRVLIANRGAIACRIIRTLKRLEIGAVAVYSDADRNSLHVAQADQSVGLGPGPAAETYLRQDKLLAAARATGADATHPGYGFLSENADFAAACEAAGIVFIGPTPDAIRRLGSKTAARTLAKDASVPTVPGSEEPAKDLNAARKLARELVYPVLLKASAGGGGKGMRRVDQESELEAAIREASSEAERAFRNSE